MNDLSIVGLGTSFPGEDGDTPLQENSYRLPPTLPPAKSEPSLADDDGSQHLPDAVD
ncbi:hypothetical protein KGQ31_00580 [Patescibacteria group bacterium]|nr:hypothetical protein [Patescibacteria group bacterium]